MTAPAVAAKAPPSDTGRCGEVAGYERHRKRWERTCQPCRDAKAQYLRDHRPRIRPALNLAELTRQALPLTSGQLACTNLPHPFRPMSSSQCRLCWGFRDDPRHLVPEVVR